jgi:outer membrane protein
MIMKKHWLLIVIVALLLGNIAIGVWNKFSTPRIAYVRSQDLVYGYFGMKEAMTEFQSKQQTWQTNLDTLNADLQRSMAGLKNLDPTTLGAADQQRAVIKQREDLMRYGDSMEKKLAFDEKEMLNAVLAQVNSYVEKYATEHGFDVVLGTTDAGSLLYGDGGMDITDELLVALNKDHESGGK